MEQLQNSLNEFLTQFDFLKITILPSTECNNTDRLVVHGSIPYCSKLFFKRNDRFKWDEDVVNEMGKPISGWVINLDDSNITFLNNMSSDERGILVRFTHTEVLNLQFPEYVKPCLKGALYGEYTIDMKKEFEHNQGYIDGDYELLLQRRYKESDNKMMAEAHLVLVKYLDTLMKQNESEEEEEQEQEESKSEQDESEENEQQTDEESESESEQEQEDIDENEQQSDNESEQEDKSETWFSWIVNKLDKTLISNGI